MEHGSDVHKAGPSSSESSAYRFRTKAERCLRLFWNPNIDRLVARVREVRRGIGQALRLGETARLDG